MVMPEDSAVDWLRASIPNVGGVTQFMQIAASRPLINEMARGNLPHCTDDTYTLVCCKLCSNNRPGIGGSFYEDQVNLINEIDEARTERLYQGEPYVRPDGRISISNTLIS